MSKINYWYNYSKKKPSKWKWIEQTIYSNEVEVEDVDSYQTSVIGKIDLKYKLTNNDIDEEYIKNMFIETFGRVVAYEAYRFERDGGLKPYLKTIYLTTEEYKQYFITKKFKDREAKLKRICY